MYWNAPSSRKLKCVNMYNICVAEFISKRLGMTRAQVRVIAREEVQRRSQDAKKKNEARDTPSEPDGATPRLVQCAAMCWCCNTPVQ